jgi:hypothetical protein
MKQVLCVLSLVILSAACQKNTNDNTVNVLNGRYNGIFSRSGMDTVAVNFFFKTDKTFEASGGRLNYPALCGGTFQQSGNNLSVNDTCTWTANFDWTLIFDGDYNISFTGANSVRIWRTNGSVTDEYLLNRLRR